MNEQGQVKSTSKVLIGLIAALVVAIVVLGVMYMNQLNESKSTQAQLTQEKDSIEANLTKMVADYRNLKTNNDTINTQLQSERGKVEGLLGELRRVKSVSYEQIKQYQRELGTLRAVMRSYITQIDSLNTLNQALISENIEVKKSYSSEKAKNQQLSEQNTSLSTQVAKGSIIKARGVNAVGINARGKEQTRASRSEKLKVCFTLVENSIAKAGIKTVYLRVTSPEGYLLAQSQGDVFSAGGENLVYSAKREVDYQNQDVDMCIFYDTKGELKAGTYSAAIFLDGSQIGSTQFVLK
jgi:cell division protein FtsB